VSGEVHGIGQAPADQRVDLDSVDLGRAFRVAIGRVLDGEAGERRIDEKLVVGERVLDRVVDLAAQLLVSHQIGGTQLVALVDPTQIFGREVVAVIGQQVDALALEVLKRGDVDGDDQPAPEIAELALIVLDPEVDLLDSGTGLLEGAHASSTTAATSGATGKTSNFGL
jgi:hypothetical protein